MVKIVRTDQIAYNSVKPNTIRSRKVVGFQTYFPIGNNANPIIAFQVPLNRHSKYIIHESNVTVMQSITHNVEL